MKKNIKFFAVAIAAIMTIGSIVFVSCNKENETVSPNASINKPNNDVTTKTGGNGVVYNQPVLIAYCNTQAGLSSLTFNTDMNAFEQTLNQMLSDSLGSNFIFNDIDIVDDNPSNPNVVPFLAVSIVDLNDGSTTTYFMDIDKGYEEGKTLYYTDGKGVTLVICRGDNCTGGCKLDETKTGCTACTNAEGHCKSTVIHLSSDGLLADAIRLTLQILGCDVS